MINGKNYQNVHHHSFCYYGNGERWQKNKCTSDYDLIHGRKKVKLIYH